MSKLAEAKKWCLDKGGYTKEELSEMDNSDILREFEDAHDISFMFPNVEDEDEMEEILEGMLNKY